MFSYRTLVRIGAAALALMAVSRATRHFRHRTDQSPRNCVAKAATRLEGIIRRRDAKKTNIFNDVI